jgi:hypothetical protein
MKSIGLLLLCLLSCAKSPTESAPDDLAKWRSLHMHNYTIEQTRSCFCVHGGEKMRLLVKNDTVFSVIRVADGAALTSAESRSYWSVEKLFSFIRASQDSLVIRYHPLYGYPEYLDINPQLHPVDGGALYETTNLKK